jgi:hypothetical protein
MVFEHVFWHGLFYAAAVNGYLLIMMVSLSPRVWGHSDYPEEIKKKVAPQTKQEKQLAMLIAIPWMLFTFGFPIYSTYALKSNLGGEISFWIAWLNVAVMTLLANLIDFVILDWLIVSRITPKFVIIPGTNKEDYKDFSHHFKAQAKATLVILLLGLIMAGLVWYF